MVFLIKQFTLLDKNASTGKKFTKLVHVLHFYLWFRFSVVDNKLTVDVRIKRNYNSFFYILFQFNFRLYSNTQNIF